MTYMVAKSRYRLILLIIILTGVTSNLALADNSCRYLFANDGNLSRANLSNRELLERIERIVILEINGIKKACSDITKMYPPENHIYVGIGRSPSPFMAFFRASGYQNLFNLPLSLVLRQTLKPKIKFNLYKHFDQFLPTPSEIGSRSLLLLDYVVTGDSLLAAREYIVDYYRDQGVNISIQILPITNSRFLVTNDQIAKVKKVIISEYMIKNNLLEQAYDNLSEYRRYRIHSSKNQKNLHENPNPYYHYLVQRFSEKIQSIETKKENPRGE